MQAEERCIDCFAQSGRLRWLQEAQVYYIKKRAVLMRRELQMELGMTKKIKAAQRKPETKNFKKAYVRPRLVEYGDVAKLTATGGSVPPADTKQNMT
jgi:hypothetical protein